MHSNNKKTYFYHFYQRRGTTEKSRYFLAFATASTYATLISSVYPSSMSFFKRIQASPDDDSYEDNDNDETIDPQLRLRTVRTAASVIAESIRSEQRAEKRKSLRQKRSFFSRNVGKEKRPPSDADTSSTGQPKEITGARRNVYVNHPLSAIEVDHHGEPIERYLRNKVRTTSESPPWRSSTAAHTNETEYTIITFVPKNLYEQFHRYAYAIIHEGKRCFNILNRVANLFFLALVILQRTLSFFALSLHPILNSNFVPQSFPCSVRRPDLPPFSPSLSFSS